MTRYDLLAESLRSSLAGTVATDVALAPLNTFGIGGPASLLVRPADIDDVVATLARCRSEGFPLYVLGAGSNIIVPDPGVDGVVLHLGGALANLTWADGLVHAQAGALDEAFARFACSHSVTGFEWIFDIPGSVGGAVYMNAGNNDGEIRETVRRVRYLTPEGVPEEAGADELALGYRTSRFQQQPAIILEASFAPRGEDAPEAIMARMTALRELRQSKFPAETLCAGSIFKRPPGHFAGRLIEEAGCGGMQVGGALVSHKHKGFIVNTGNATAEDVLTLIEQVKARVLEHSGVQLTTEVEAFKPFWIPA